MGFAALGGVSVVLDMLSSLLQKQLMLVALKMFLALITGS
jgi:hypothetical protein